MSHLRAEIFPISKLNYFPSQNWHISHLKTEIFPISKLTYFPSQSWNISHLRAEIFLLNSQYWWNCVFSDFIEKLETMEVSKEETGSSCPICLKGYEAGETISSLPCKHSFHANCLLPWLQVNLCKPLAHSGWFYRVSQRKRALVLYVVFIWTFMFRKRPLVLYVVLNWTIMLRTRLQVLYNVLN